MTLEEFNEAQKIELPNGEFQKDFDVLIDKIISELYS